MPLKNLDSNDKEFFTLVSLAATANPFSQQRVEIDREISGSKPSDSWQQIKPEAISEVARRISKLDEVGLARIEDFVPAQREIIEQVFLFDVYHRFIKRFDELIDSQVKAADQPVVADFAKDVLTCLAVRGFTKDVAKRYFSLFYQMRRAFHFIEHGLIGKCPSMGLLRMNLWNNIFTHNIRHYERYLWDKMEDFSTLLLGPTGCGKGAAAAAIGRSGFIAFDEKKQTFAESFTETFIPINLSQYAESLLESELFGHTKGAFTGAVSSHEGLFALCGRYGSIFLDEIGEVSTQVQIKLLQVLQERIFSPVGSHKKLNFRGRVIAATNRSIDELRSQGRFRDDFYYRLCSDCIMVPSLQQRLSENPSELDELIAHTVARITGHRSDELIEMVKEVIAKNLGCDYHWPGNVRELAQCVRRVIIKRNYQGDQRIPKDARARLIAGIDTETLDASQLLAGYCNILYKKHGTYEKVGKITGMDRRTVKKYIKT